MNKKNTQQENKSEQQLQYDERYNRTNIHIMYRFDKVENCMFLVIQHISKKDQ